MISLKKLLFETIDKTRLRVQTAQVSSGINGNSDNVFTSTASITSGVPVGIVGFALSGTVPCFVSEIHLSGSSGGYMAKIHNTSSNSGTFTLVVYILVRG